MLDMLKSFWKQLQAREGDTKIEVRIGVARVGMQCLPIAFYRLAQFLLLLEGIAQIVVRVGVAGVDFQCLAETEDRFGHMPLLLELRRPGYYGHPHGAGLALNACR